MIQDLHNLLHLPGPLHQSEDEAQIVDEEQQAADVELEDDLPMEYRYLRELEYNQPRSPRKNNVIKYFDFNYDGWLRIQVISKHKKLSKYAGLVNCVYLDINREPDGLYFARGDFWSILEQPGDYPEVNLEVARQELREILRDMSDVASQYSIRDMSIPPPPATSSAASSGLAPMVTGDQPLAPNMVYTIPPPPLSFFPPRML